MKYDRIPGRNIRKLISQEVLSSDDAETVVERYTRGGTLSQQRSWHILYDGSDVSQIDACDDHTIPGGKRRAAKHEVLM